MNNDNLPHNLDGKLLYDFPSPYKEPRQMFTANIHSN